MEVRAMSQLGRAVPAGAVMSAPPFGRPVRPDPVAAVLLLVAGGAGIWQLFAPWLKAGPATIGGGDPVAPSGWQVYRALRLLPTPGPEVGWATLAVLGGAVAGGALIVLGLAMFAPINHRPLGAAGLLISLLSMAGALWVIMQARQVVGLGVFGLFGQAGVGLYLFLGSGLLGLIGAWKALSTG
jgi:hypothetical protein